MGRTTGKDTRPSLYARDSRGRWVCWDGRRWAPAPGAQAGERKAKGNPRPPQKPDRVKAIKAVAAAMARGQKKRDVCKDIYGAYGYPTWAALERAYDRG